MQTLWAIANKLLTILGSVSVNAVDSGSRGCGFDSSRGRIHDFVVVGSSSGRGSPRLSSLRVDTVGTTSFSWER